MSNSPLVSYTKIRPIDTLEKPCHDTITIHCVETVTVQQLEICYRTRRGFSIMVLAKTVK